MDVDVHHFGLLRKILKEKGLDFNITQTNSPDLLDLLLLLQDLRKRAEI